LERSRSVINGIERNLRIRPFSFFPFMPSLFKSGVFFLETRRVQQYNLSNLRGGSSAVNLALESLSYQFGYQPAVVEVGMGEQDRVQFPGWYRERVPVPMTQLSFLVKPAFNQKLKAISLQQIP